MRRDGIRIPTTLLHNELSLPLPLLIGVVRKQLLALSLEFHHRRVILLHVPLAHHLVRHGHHIVRGSLLHTILLLLLLLLHLHLLKHRLPVGHHLRVLLSWSARAHLHLLLTLLLHSHHLLHVLRRRLHASIVAHGLLALLLLLLLVNTQLIGMHHCRMLLLLFGRYPSVRRCGHHRCALDIPNGTAMLSDPSWLWSHVPTDGHRWTHARRTKHLRCTVSASNLVLLANLPSHTRAMDRHRSRWSCWASGTLT